MKVRPVMQEADKGSAVRRASAADGGEIERLIVEGMLPGRVAYRSDEAERIRQSLGLDREREGFWVAEADGKVIGTVAVAEVSRDVGHVHWLRVAPEVREKLIVAQALAWAAAEHAREFGFLKLAVHAPPDAEERVSSYYHRLGFEFSRAREVEGVHVLEFYLNLYERPRPKA